ncbi:Immunoglobulin kappa constant [Merluccius polli]|nr:Immunoglobulin kappa constant [Merluccius polli]
MADSLMASEKESSRRRLRLSGSGSGNNSSGSIILRLLVVAAGLRMGVVQPTLSLLPPSTVEQEQCSATVLCTASGGFPSDWTLGWKVGGSGVSGGVSDSPGVLGKDGRYSWSSTLTLPADRWRKAGSVSCEASKSGQTPVAQTLNPDQC